MDYQHPSPEQLAQFLAGAAELGREDRNLIVSHLITGCTLCQRVIELETNPRLKLVPNYDEVFRKAEMMAVLMASQINLEQELSPALWDYLRPLDHPSRLLVIRNDSRFQIWGLVDYIEGMVRPMKDEPFVAVDLAHLAVEISRHLSEEDYGARAHDLRGSALSTLSVVMRKAGDFQGAADALGEAREELRQGTGDPTADAMLAVNTASLLHDLGSFEEAVTLLDSAIRLFNSVKHDRGIALTMVQQVTIYRKFSPARGIELAEEALALLYKLDSPENTYAELTARHELAWCYNDLGDHEEALQIVETYDYLYRQFIDALTVGSRLWLLGKIHFRAGRFAKSNHSLEYAYNTFIGVHLHFDATLVTLDRIEALIYLRKIPEAIKLAQRMEKKLKAWGLRDDTLRLWGLIGRAIEFGEFIEAGFSGRIAAHLRVNWIPRPSRVDLAADDRRFRQ
jgi:tetratricopeptide (TPR) repeat protein